MWSSLVIWSRSASVDRMRDGSAAYARTPM